MRRYSSPPGQQSHYFSNNDTGDINPTIIWAAHKSVLRGHFIRAATHTKKAKTLRRTDHQHKHNPTTAKLYELQALRHSVRELSVADVAHSILRSRRLFYKKANKMDTLLARTLRPRQESKPITTLRNSSNVVVNTPRDTNLAFTEYYRGLYDHTPRDELAHAQLLTCITDFLAHTDLPKIA
ncbi:Hypothetical predicted protein [Pelobates cultripes]|uniref:Uncharacterized protein n=1 Tax=Pelobates cultripes TaxID=61616 RepID=A0AAD1VKD5_PELCU|nr:Hypothetical predicted protein [Pelobates cultripes]